MIEGDVARPLVAIVGDASAAPDTARWTLALELGTALVDAGYRVITGGLGGVMQAASQGARSSARWQPGDVVGIVPGSDRSAANPFVDIVICTGLDHGRNMIVAQAQALVAVGGGAGTLAEIAFAWMYRRLIIGMRCGGWSERLADQRVDERMRYAEIPDDRVFGATTANDAVALLDAYLPLYAGTHRGIPGGRR